MWSHKILFPASALVLLLRWITFFFVLTFLSLEIICIYYYYYYLICSVKNAGAGCVLCLETEDVEAAVAKAVAAGAVAEGDLADGADACCGGGGGRVGEVKDPYGFTWLICSPAKKCAEAE